MCSVLSAAFCCQRGVEGKPRGGGQARPEPVQRPSASAMNQGARVAVAAQGASHARRPQRQQACCLLRPCLSPVRVVTGTRPATRVHEPRLPSQPPSPVQSAEEGEGGWWGRRGGVGWGGGGGGGGRGGVGWGGICYVIPKAGQMSTVMESWHDTPREVQLFSVPRYPRDTPF